MGKGSETKWGRLSPGVITGAILLLIFGISLLIRIYLPHNLVFAEDWVRFRDTDPWYHMRLVDSIVHNFPHGISFDPYLDYPIGREVSLLPFWYWLLALVTWVIGLGSPSQHTIDAVGAYFPAILGALIVIPVYFIGKEVFNRWAGVLAAALIAVIPGEFLLRTLLGMPDQHVAEIFFSTLTIMFLILTIKHAQERQLSFGRLLGRDWATITKPLVYTFLTGITLGIYLLTWAGGLFLVFIITIYVIVQFIIDHMRHKSTDYLGIIGVLVFFIASIMVFPQLSQVSWAKSFYQASLLIAIVVPLALSAISRLMTSQRIKPAYYPLALGGLGLVGITIFYAINPSLVKEVLSQFTYWFTPKPLIGEMRPLLFVYGDFTFSQAWLNFTTGFFIAFITLGLLIYEVSKKGAASKTLLLVWSLIMLIFTLGMLRWAYYLAINVALLTGYFSWKVLALAGFRERPETEVPPRLKQRQARVKPKAARKRVSPFPASRTKLALAVIVIFFLVFFFNLSSVQPAVKAGWQQAGTITSDLHDSLNWLRTSTPEPFGNPDFYYQLYQAPPQGEKYDYPPSAYGVMALWHYGYWITRIAHRIPLSGSQDRFFTSQEETSANQIMDELGAKYVIADSYAVAIFPTLLSYAGRDRSQFYEVYYQLKADGKLAPVLLYYPAYYYSMIIQLHNFGGKAVVPENSTTVISYKETLSREGEQLKQITDFKTFPTYNEAKTYLAKQKSDNYRIVGTSRFTSPVPLDELKHYKLINSTPEVKIFEYIKLPQETALNR